jgi:hypothetical protein
MSQFKPKFTCQIVSQLNHTQQLMVAKNDGQHVWLWVLTASIGRTYSYDDNAWLNDMRRKVNARLYENRKLVPEHWTDLHASAAEPEVPNEEPEVERHADGSIVRYRKDGRVACRFTGDGGCTNLPRAAGLCGSHKTGM